jgi:tripartite-type tricarboxylate transporter receptor subunit TctC
MKRASACGLAAVSLLAFAGSALAQQPYPSRPIRFIVANAPGGSNSFVARLVGDGLSANLGHQVVVDNRPGGDGVIAAETLKRAAPDGHTILLSSAALVIRPLLHPNKVYDNFLREFVPVATLVSTDYILVVNASVPAQDVKELIALAKLKPGYFKAAVSNIGGVNHLALELFNVVAGVKIKAIPYKGGGPGMTALVGGEVSLAINNAITVGPHVASGKLRALGVASKERLATLPQVPTFTEVGLPEYGARNWFGVVVPGRTPRAVIDTLASEIQKVQASPSFKEKIATQGVQPFVSGPAEYAAFVKAEMTRYAHVIKQANVKVE